MDPIIHVHIADIHFGCIDPKTEFDILIDQFINKIYKMPFHILSIDGDLFDRKFYANDDAVTYAIKFVNICLEMCVKRNAVLIIISGTKSHESNQLSLFRDLVCMYPANIRVVEEVQFLYLFDYKILCIPEMYGMPIEYYESFLRESYDMVFMHGTLVGGVYGANKEKLDSSREPVFSIDSFSSCKGPIISGHVHKAMCLNSYMYYVSNPIRYRFGEEEEKGFAICISGPAGHRYEFIPITSFRYDTINIDTIMSTDPEVISKKLDELHAQGIDYIRLDMRSANPEYYGPAISILEQKYAQDSTVSIMKPSVNRDEVQVNTTEAISAKYEGMDFLLDPKLSELERLVTYINYNKGCEFITVDGLKKLLE
jgi:DNA repair exonuclease SbcCD nuclease subunit